jgi:hypothetical protein
MRYKNFAIDKPYLNTAINNATLCNMFNDFSRCFSILLAPQNAKKYLHFANPFRKSQIAHPLSINFRNIKN